VKIRILSDLHLEFLGWQPPPGAEDVVVLAGDIAEGVCGVSWAREHFPRTPVIYVPGNHEYYGFDFDEMRERLRETGRAEGVHVLDGDEIVIGGVRFLGATLWTDFEIAGSRPARIEYVMRKCQDSITDYHVIRRWGSVLSPGDTWQIHREHRAWLRRMLHSPEDARTVVVTHHAPSERSVAPRYQGDTLNASFASDLTDLLGPPVSLWVHGHMHDSSDYVERGTRVICNPRGYLPMEPNPDFDPELIVEV
jgi:Icc-related predicted phosphoesterase